MTNKEPKDLGLKVGTKKEARWKQYKDACEERIINFECEIEVAKAGIELADREMAKEQQCTQSS